MYNRNQQVLLYNSLSCQEDICVKQHSAFYQWFWDRPLFRRLRARLMTMVLALVLPLSVVAIALSIQSAFQGAAISDLTSKNGFLTYLEKVALRYELGDLDVVSDFPATLAEVLSPLNLVQEEGVTAEHGGKVYVSRDGEEAFLIHADGTYEKADESFDTLAQSKYAYLWQVENQPFRALVVFPYNFALRHIPGWFWSAILISLFTVVACPILYGRLKRDVLNPMETMHAALSRFQDDRSYRIPPQPLTISDDYLQLFEHFNAMAAEVQQSHEKDVKLLETEMDNLRLQVNPHMLLNSYNTIYALAESKNYPVIQDYTLCLVDYFRYVLRRGQQLVTVGQELEFVDNYIRIQRIRFPGRFSYVYQAAEECLNARIPPLLIENFVENAIKYALEPREAIEIVVSVRKDQNRNEKDALHIAITDTGSGIKPQVLEKLKAHEPYIDESGKKHIGIYNCLRRIELFYGEEGEVHFSSGEGKGTQIYMVVPFLALDDENEGRQ